MGHLFLQVWGKMGHLHILLIKYHKGKMGHPKVKKFFQQKNRGWGKTGHLHSLLIIYHMTQFDDQTSLFSMKGYQIYIPRCT